MAKRQRQTSDERAHRGHHDRPKPQQADLMNRLFGRCVFPLRARNGSIWLRLRPELPYCLGRSDEL